MAPVPFGLSYLRLRSLRGKKEPKSYWWAKTEKKNNEGAHNV